MTPAINILKKNKTPFKIHEYEHDHKSGSYGLEAAEKIGVEARRVYKTLVVDAGGKLAVGIVPVDKMLSLKSIAKALGEKKCEMAKADAVQRSSGYVLGGVSPLGQKRVLKTIIDDLALGFKTIFISGGKRGLDVELAPKDLAKILNAKFEGISA